MYFINCRVYRIRSVLFWCDFQLCKGRIKIINIGAQTAALQWVMRLFIYWHRRKYLVFSPTLKLLDSYWKEVEYNEKEKNYIPMAHASGNLFFHSSAAGGGQRMQKGVKSLFWILNSRSRFALITLNQQKTVIHLLNQRIVQLGDIMAHTAGMKWSLWICAAYLQGFYVYHCKGCIWAGAPHQKVNL